MTDFNAKGEVVATGEGHLDGMRAWCHVMYALYAVSVISMFVPILGSGRNAIVSRSVATFLFPLLVIAFNHATTHKVAGTWLDTHWYWIRRTFWRSLMWTGVALAVGVAFVGLMTGTEIAKLPVLNFFVVGIGSIVVIAAIFLPLLIWVAVRIVRGWLALRAGKPMPMPMAT